jgi:hypothetical protein
MLRPAVWPRTCKHFIITVSSARRRNTRWGRQHQCNDSRSYKMG